MYQHWSEQREGVALQLIHRESYRHCTTLHTLGIADAQSEFEEIDGLLSIQVLLEDVEFTGDMLFSTELESQKN